MNIAQHIIGKCLGPGNVRRLLKVSRSRPYGWIDGGYIPARWQRPLLQRARAEGIDLRPEDFLGLDADLNPLPGVTDEAGATLARGRDSRQFNPAAEGNGHSGAAKSGDVP